MADIFSVVPGAVVAVSSPGIPMRMFLEGWDGYPLFKSIITGFRVTTAGGVQFLHTLRDFLYVYAFGERIGELTLDGISFAYQCENADISFHGLEYVMAYYLRSRATSFPRPITIVLGGALPFFGFLTNLTMGLTDAERVLGQFSYTFKVIPSPSVLDLLFS